MNLQGSRFRCSACRWDGKKAASAPFGEVRIKYALLWRKSIKPNKNTAAERSGPCVGCVKNSTARSLVRYLGIYHLVVKQCVSTVFLAARFTLRCAADYLAAVLTPVLTVLTLLSACGTIDNRGL